MIPHHLVRRRLVLHIRSSQITDKFIE